MKFASCHEDIDFAPVGMIIVGRPTKVGDPNATCYIYDEDMYQAFRKTCKAAGRDPEDDPHMTFLREKNRAEFLEVCVSLQKVLPVLGMMIMAFCRESGEPYPEPVERIHGMAPTNTMWRADFETFSLMGGIN